MLTPATAAAVGGRPQEDPRTKLLVAPTIRIGFQYWSVFDLGLEWDIYPVSTSPMPTEKFKRIVVVGFDEIETELLGRDWLQDHLATLHANCLKQDGEWRVMA